MHLNTLKAFRHEISGTMKRAKDALFNLLDALMTENQAKSLVELSLSPHFERKWSSIYEALEDGKIDQKQLQEVFARYLPQPNEGEPLRIAVDTTGIAHGLRNEIQARRRCRAKPFSHGMRNEISAHKQCFTNQLHRLSRPHRLLTGIGGDVLLPCVNRDSHERISRATALESYILYGFPSSSPRPG